MTAARRARRCRRCGHLFSSGKGLSSHMKDKHAAYYYSTRVAPIPLAAVALVALAAYLGPLAAVSSSSKDLSAESVLDMALPVVTEAGLSSESIKLSSTIGKPALVEFMVSWCNYCQDMAPILEELYSEYGDSVSFISIAGTWRGADADTTADFIRTYHTTWPHVLDSQNAVFEYYDVKSTPTFLLFDSDGELAARIAGAVPLERLDSELQRLR